MTSVLLVLVAVVATLIVVKVAIHLWRHRAPRTGLIADVCTTCGVELPPHKAWTLTAEKEPHVDGQTHLLAGSYISADYCRQHAPAGAVGPKGQKVGA